MLLHLPLNIVYWTSDLYKNLSPFNMCSVAVSHCMFHSTPLDASGSLIYTVLINTNCALLCSTICLPGQLICGQDERPQALHGHCWSLLPHWCWSNIWSSRKVLWFGNACHWKMLPGSGCWFWQLCESSSIRSSLWAPLNSWAQDILCFTSWGPEHLVL